jgi:hypothetical protein
VLAVLAVLTAYGIIDGGDVPLWIALAAAVLGIGTNALATLNTTVRTPLPPPPPPETPDGYMTIGQCITFAAMLVGVYAVIFVCLLAFR